MSGEPEMEPGRQFGIKRFASELLSEMVNLDRGVPGTYIALFKNPSEVVEDYFTGAGRFMNPFRYTVFVSSFVTVFLALIIDFQGIYRQTVEMSMGVGIREGLQSLPEGTAAYFDLLINTGWLMTSKYMAVTYIILLAPCLGLSSYIFFKRKKKFYSQHFIMNMYLAAQVGTFQIIVLPVMDLTGSALYTGIISQPLLIGYLLWIYYRYFSLEGFGKGVKILVSCVFGYFMYFILMNIVMHGITALRYFW